MKKIILIVLLIFVVVFLMKIGLTLSKISKSSEKTIYNVLVNKGKKVTKSQIRQEKVGYISFDPESTKFSKKVSYKSFPDVYSMLTSLRSKDIGAMILKSNLMSLIDTTDFEVISRFSVTSSSKVKADSSDTFIIYISGADTFGDISTISRSDVNIILAFNKSTNKVLLISIPRDFYIPFNNSKDKLTHISIYGMDDLIKAINDFFKINIDYYVKVNFSSFETFIDLLGGIDVYSSTSFESVEGYKYYLGNNFLDGAKALAFVRERYAFKNGDLSRLVNIEEVIKSIVSKISDINFLLGYNKILSNISNMIETNIPESIILDLVKNGINSKTTWDITTYSLSGTNGYEYTYTYPSQKLYVMIPDESYKNVKEEIRKIQGD